MAEPTAPKAPSIDDLGDALFGSALRRFENRVMERFDRLALLIEQQAVDKEALAAALGTLDTADQTIDSIEPEAGETQ